MAITDGARPHWSVLYRAWRLFWVELMVPCRISTPKEGHYVRGYEHECYGLGWGDPDGRWRLLFRLPF